MQERIAAQVEHLKNKGHKIELLTSLPSYPGGFLYPGYKTKLFQTEVIDSIHVFRAWSFISPKKGFLPRLAGFVSFMFTSILVSFMTGKYDAVIVEYPPLFTGISGFTISRFKRCRFILHVSDLWVEAGIAFGIFRNNMLVSLISRIERFLCRKANKIVTVTDGCKRSLVRKNISSNKITVIPNGVNIDIYRSLADKGDLKRRLNFENKFIVTYAGTHGYIHGVETVIEAAKLLENQKEFLFLFIGEGSEKNRVVHMAQKHNLKNVKFFDQIQPNKLNEYLSMSGIGVATLRNIPLSENALSVKMLTYMACKLPTIFSGNGVSRDILEDSNSGVCIEPENPDELAKAIRLLYDNEVIRLRYGENGRKYVKKYYSRAELAKRFEEVLLN